MDGQRERCPPGGPRCLTARSDVGSMGLELSRPTPLPPQLLSMGNTASFVFLHHMKRVAGLGQNGQAGQTCAKVLFWGGGRVDVAVPPQADIASVPQRRSVVHA